MPEHANCKSCKCEPEVLVYEFPVTDEARKQLSTYVGLSVASVLQSIGQDPFKAKLQLQFEYDTRYLRDKLVVRLTGRS